MESHRVLLTSPLKKIRLPYPGLRPYQRDEAVIFFGRDEQVDQLLVKLDQTRFLAVVGVSGCGKSSLVQAGMIPALGTGLMVSAGSRWQVATMRPGDRPLANLAEALLKDQILGERRSAIPNAAAFLEATLRRGPLGLIEVLRETPLAPSTKLLLLVDQFEEIFRFRKRGVRDNYCDRDEADAFVALVLETVEQARRAEQDGRDDVPVYVVLTMRSDYLGDCAVFPKLPEALNDSQFLTPRLTRDQRRAAIEEPARVFGGSVEPALVNRLLNDMAMATDEQLPLMQHVLMRVWALTTEAAEDTEEVTAREAVSVTQSPGQILLSASTYEAVGGLAYALSQHADETYQELAPEDHSVAEALFRCLSERGEGRRDTRRPIPLQSVAEIAGVSTERVARVVEAFRRPGRSFLTPPPSVALESGTILDISHESLIRQWKTLNAWVDDDSESAAMYRRLADTARLWKAGRAALWSTPDLENALAWRQRERPTAAWAERYGGQFESSMQFLEASAEARRQQEEQRRRVQSRRLRRVIALLTATSLLVVFLLISICGWWYLYIWPYVTYYNAFEKQYGVPKGIGKELDLSEVKHRPVSFKFIRQGSKGLLLTIQAINGLKELTTDHGVGTYMRYRGESGDPIDMPTRECQWEFVYDEKIDHVVYEKALDRFGNLVWGLIYSPTEHVGPAPPRSAKGHFVGPDGYPQPQRHSEAEYVEIQYDENGFETALRWFDRQGNPMPGQDNAYGVVRKFDARGLRVRQTSVNEHDEPMVDAAGNATLEIEYDSLGDPVLRTARDNENRIVCLNEGWAIFRAKYDKYGNSIRESYFDEQDSPTRNKYGYHRRATASLFPEFLGVFYSY